MLTVMITGARAPVALDLARRFHKVGHRVVLADVPAHPIAKSSRSVSAYERLPSPRDVSIAFARAAIAAAERQGAALVIPTCEEVFHLGLGWEAEKPKIPLFAPPMASLTRAHSKFLFAQDAVGLGVDPPRTRLISNREEVAAFADDARNLVFKPVWSRFATRTLIGPAREILLNKIVPTPADPWVAQDLCPGEELCAYAIASHGEMKAFALYEPKWRVGQAAGAYFEPRTDIAAEAFTRGFIAKTNWHGQISFDFKRDQEGRLRVLECNPRATSGIHILEGRDDDLVAAILGEPSGELIQNRQSPAMLAPVLQTNARWRALSTGKSRPLAEDMKRATDVIADTEDPIAIYAIAAAFFETLGVALSKGVGPIKAATFDIEWNGPDAGQASSE
jgi:predicted ATP-grasp superfamily ATP-dependent carboligase